MTQAQIQVLINQIVTGANYRANQMNPLLTDILAAAYGPMFIDNAPPSGNEDETQGYRPGSVAYDTSSQRFFICKDATAGAADWVLIPADANYEYKLYSSAGDGMTLLQNTSVFKADNNSLAVNLGCYVDLPANPYRGKVVILYFQDSIDQFDIRDSLGVPISAGASLTIIGGDQYTIVYNGSIWEIIGIANINPATLSNVAVTKGATVIPNTTAINFIGSSVTVAPNGSGADVTISPVTGVDIQVNAFPLASPADFINITGTNLVTTVNTTGVNLTYVSKIGIQKDGTTLTNAFYSVGTFNFKGTMFEVVDFNVGLNVVNVESNGPLTWYGFANMIPGASDDDTQGYSRGSFGINSGTLKRNYICTDNTTGAAIWEMISQDNGYESPALVGGPGVIITTSPSTANVAFAAVATLSAVRINLPAFPYIGKKVFISFQSDVTSGAQIRNSAASLQFGAAVVISGATPANPKVIIAVCIDDITQTWARLQ
jgi:hypothetical protein